MAGDSNVAHILDEDLEALAHQSEEAVTYIDLADEWLEDGRDAALHVHGLSRGHVVRDVSFTVGRGEIVGLSGLVGAGRTETLRLIFGADQPDAGHIRLTAELNRSMIQSRGSRAESNRLLSLPSDFVRVPSGAHRPHLKFWTRALL